MAILQPEVKQAHGAHAFFESDNTHMDTHACTNKISCMHAHPRMRAHKGSCFFWS